jgi:sporulation protein YlmC with PRC-barrel domain
MNKITLTAAALAAVLATPAFAQQSPPASTPAAPPAVTSPAPSGSMQDQDKGAASDKGSMSDKSASDTGAKAGMKDTADKSDDMKKASAGDKKPGFVQNQSAEEWRASKLIGASVYGPDDKSIGGINDVIVTGDGSIKAVVVGVGGFLGVGEKDVAVPFESLSVSRKADSNAIDKITVSFSTEELKNAPDFAFYKAPTSQTTGSSSATSPMSRPSPMGGAGGAAGGAAK